MAVPSPVGDVKIVSPIGTFVLNTLTLKKCIFFVLNNFAITVCFERNMMIVSHNKAAKMYKLITYSEFLLFQVCRQAGYFKHAVYLAEKYDQHDL